MEQFNFITIRLGKDSIPDIQNISSSTTGVLNAPFTISVKCTQIPENFRKGDYAFLWLGSDNNKGMPTQWKQGFKAIGRVLDVIRGEKYNDTSDTRIEIVYIFDEAINRMDILRCAPIAYYWCSSLPLIGLDDHANQTIRSMSGNSFADIRAFFSSIEAVTHHFKGDITKIEPRFEVLFDILLPDPQSYPNANNLNEISPTKLIVKNTYPLQQVFYGAPGTGKSNTIKCEVEEKKRIHFRTTFHPDSDYSTFVGCYKPTKEEKREKSRSLLDKDELVAKLKEYRTLYDETMAQTQFGYDYYEELRRSTDLADIIKEAGVKTFDTAVRIGMSLAERTTPKTKQSFITYSFVPQAFTKAYCEAWNNYNPEGESEPVFLIIEEINRGNCAQIFGDIFQLLDRETVGERTGFSTYPIDADEDLKKFLMTGTKEDGSRWLTNEEGIKDGKLCLPPNLFIWATMNTSDQSLFPIDSAFKRRWDWKYMPIDTTKEQWGIEVNGKDYSWGSFLDQVNDEIGETTSSEDKKLGFYFCKASGTTITAERFVSKVLFYIYNDVFKDYGLDSREFFKDKETGKVITFQSLFNMDGSVKEPQVEKILTNLKVTVVSASTSTNEETENDAIDSDTKGDHKESLVAVTIDGERIASATQFDTYLNALKKIGIDRMGPAIEALKYQRRGSKMATKTKEPSIETATGYSYVEADGYYFVKGMNGYTMVRILEDLSKAYDLNLQIEYK